MFLLCELFFVNVLLQIKLVLYLPYRAMYNWQHMTFSNLRLLKVITCESLS